MGGIERETDPPLLGNKLKEWGKEFARLVFPKKNGVEVEGVSGCASA
jgi:hypothetical protein